MGGECIENQQAGKIFNIMSKGDNSTTPSDYNINITDFGWYGSHLTLKWNHDKKVTSWGIGTDPVY